MVSIAPNYAAGVVGTQTSAEGGGVVGSTHALGRGVIWRRSEGIQVSGHLQPPDAVVYDACQKAAVVYDAYQQAAEEEYRRALEGLSSYNRGSRQHVELHDPAPRRKVLLLCR